ncbi:MAG: hypothetical protein IJ025_06930 [Clostridia bacterium]|nr:hypothetical protein [Clostridia bacterium]
MKKYGNKILKAVSLIGIFLMILPVPAIFIFDDIPKESTTSLLNIWFFLLLICGIVIAVLLVLGYRPDEKEKVEKNGNPKEIYTVYGPVVMRISVVLSILFLLLIPGWGLIIKEQSIFEILVKISFFTSMFLGILSFLLLLFCTPKENNNSERYKIECNNFIDYNKFMESVFLKNKFKKHYYTETQNGCEIYVYKGRKFTSINYYFIINLTDLSDESSLVELDAFMSEVLRSESILCFGTVKANAMICVNEKTNNLEEKLTGFIKGYRGWTTSGIGVVFDEQKVYLPSCKGQVRIGLMQTMKREFKELVGISKPVSKNPLIRWIIGNSKEKVILTENDCNHHDI